MKSVGVEEMERGCGGVGEGGMLSVIVGIVKAEGVWGEGTKS